MGITIKTLLLVALCVEALVLAVFWTINNKQQRFENGKVLFIPPNKFSIFIAPPLIAILCLTIVSCLRFDSEIKAIAAVCIAGFLMLYGLSIKTFVWVHFYEDKIVVRHPLSGALFEIPLWKVKSACTKLANGNLWLVVEYFEKGEVKTYSFKVTSGHQVRAIEKYFLTRDLYFLG